MKDITSCLSHNSDDWKTPSSLYDLVVFQKGFKDLFPFQCSYDEFKNWYVDDKLFINPPYSKMNKVVDYVDYLIKLDNRIILLVPSRTDTIWFNKLANIVERSDFCNLIFIKGRLHFNDSKSAPFPSCIFIFGFKIHRNKFLFLNYNELLIRIREID